MLRRLIASVKLPLLLLPEFEFERRPAYFFPLFPDPRGREPFSLRHLPGSYGLRPMYGCQIASLFRDRGAGLPTYTPRSSLISISSLPLGVGGWALSPESKCLLSWLLSSENVMYTEQAYQGFPLLCAQISLFPHLWGSRIRGFFFFLSQPPCYGPSLSNYLVFSPRSG